MGKKIKVTLIQGDGSPMRAKSINRNELCPCGSGKKVKHCHKLETKYYTTKKPQVKEIV